MAADGAVFVPAFRITGVQPGLARAALVSLFHGSVYGDVIPFDPTSYVRRYGSEGSTTPIRALRTRLGFS
jgi:hypothetical protein